MTAAAISVELGWCYELGGQDNEGFVEKVLFSAITHQGGEAVGEF